MKSSTLDRVDGIAPARLGGWREIVDDYVELTKPRIIVLLLVTTLASMVMAARGIPPLATVLWTMIGGGLASASAGAFNCVWDRDIDRLMRRTMHRPVARGAISVAQALTFASITGIVAFALLFFLVNPLAAWLSLCGNVYYVVVYTMLLKRATALNIVIGGAAGAIPPLVGWAAVSNSLGGPAIGLFALIFLWTPPHFWALALMTETDYGRAGVPMLPNVRGARWTKWEIVAYTIALVGTSLALVPLHVMGPLYCAAAAVLGGIFVVDAVRMLRDETKRSARITFQFSLLYLALMCAAMVADRVSGL